MRSGAFWLLVVCAVLLASAEVKAAITVDYSNIGTFTTASLNQGGVTVIGSNLVNVHQYDGSFKGLGIVGGTIWPYDTYVDSGESITFSFNAGAAADVRFYSSSVRGLGTAYASISAVAPGGASLGSITVNLFSSPYDRDVSGLFGNVAMQSFTVTAGYNNSGQPTGFNVSSLAYTTQVPEPSTLIIWSLLGGLAISLKWRRRKAA